MNDGSQIDASKTPAYVWVSFIFSVVGGVVGFVVGQYVHLKELDLKRREVDDRVYSIKLDIIKQVQNANLEMADAIMLYLLEPIEEDKQQFVKFRVAVNNLMSDKASSLPSKKVEPLSSVTGVTTDFQYSREAVRAKFAGNERLNFRNELIVAHRSNPKDVIKALIDAIVTPQENGLNQYRINLYVAFTLGGLPGGWISTQEQYNRVGALRNTPEYTDPTFKDRLEEEIKNHT
jgi:hypothetical protein